MTSESQADLLIRSPSLGRKPQENLNAYQLKIPQARPYTSKTKSNTIPHESIGGGSALLARSTRARHSIQSNFKTQNPKTSKANNPYSNSERRSSLVKSNTATHDFCL